MAIDDVPEVVRQHLRALAEESGRSDDFLDELARVWIQKAALFESQAKAVHLELVESIPANDPRGALILSFSGSLLSIGPDTDKTLGRWLEYSSIRLRTDVPDIVVDRGITVNGVVKIGEGVKLNCSKIKQTSPVFAIAVCPLSLHEDEQDKRIRESTIFITNGFMKYNRTLQVDRDNIPDQFTMKSMTRYLAKKHGLTGNEAKLLIDDFVTLVETGMLLGDSVPLGRIGRLSVKKREAQKARVLKHPNTGDEIMVGAKPARGVPKISFSTQMKEQAAHAGF